MITSANREHLKNVVMALNAIWNIVYGLFSYLRLALELFWEEYGEDIQICIVRFLFFSLECSGRTFLFGQQSRRHFDAWLARQLDSAFFQLIDIH